MNLEEHKDKIDEFFNSLSEEELKAKFKKYSGRDYFRTQIQNEPLPPVNFNRSLEWSTSLTEMKEYYNVKLIEERNIYSYTDSERGYSEYKLLKDNISFKHPDTGEWIEAVLYKSLKDGKEYVRQKVDFLSKFKKVK